MKSICLWGMALFTLCAAHAGATQGVAYFSMLAGEHNTVACLLQAEAPDRGYRLTVGVSPHPVTQKLMGKVRLRRAQADHAGVPTEAVELSSAQHRVLLDVALTRTDATTSMAELPAQEVSALMRVLTGQSHLQIRVGDSASGPAQSFVLRAQGEADPVHDCLRNIERDTAPQQADPASPIRDVASAIGYYDW